MLSNDADANPAAKAPNKRNAREVWISSAKTVLSSTRCRLEMPIISTTMDTDATERRRIISSPGADRPEIA